METLMRVAQVLIAVAMIGIILVQRGTGANAGAGFGAGASGTVFGSRGSGTFLTRATGFLAASFFALSMTMGVMASKSTQVQTDGLDLGVMSGVSETAETEVPELPGVGVGADLNADDVPPLPELGPDGAAAGEVEPESSNDGQ